MYGENQYNTNLYNYDLLFIALSEAISGTDTELPYPQIVKTELVTLAEAITKLLNNDPWFDDIMPIESVVAFLINKVLNGDIILLSDVIDILPNKISTETINLLETLIANFNTAYADFIFLTDILTKQVTNKGMFDSIRTNDWLLTNKLFVEEWHD